MEHQPSSDDQRTETRRVKRPLWRSILVPVLILIVALVGWWLVIANQTPPPAVRPTPPTIFIDEGQVLREERERFYTTEIEPLLKATERSNRETAERAVVRVTDVFKKYRSGIKPFADDITSIGTRFGILRRMPANWWYEDDRINIYIQEKFESHLFSEDQFHNDIVAVLKTFREDLQANESRLLASVRAAIEAGDLPEMALPDYRQYEEEIRAIILEFSGDRARDSVYQGIATFVVAEVAAIAVHQIIVRILAAIGTSAATSAIAGGGATAGGAAAGGGAGTLGGPVGVAIGIGAGLVVGIIVDWWMTDRFQNRLADDLNNYFDELESGLLNGTDDDAGLRATVAKFIDDLSFAQTTVVHRALVGGER